MIHLDPHGPVSDLVPWDAWPVEPSDDEMRVWTEAVRDFYHEECWMPGNVRLVWYSGGDPRLLGQTYGTRPPIVTLRAGRPLRDLYATCVHELKHVSQLSFSEDAWSVEECEADAQAFALRLTGRRG
jgi:hypothetical protein